MIDRSTFSRIWHPEAGHDRGKSPYFEGWYVKLVGADRKFRMAVIPGLFRSADGTAEAMCRQLERIAGLENLSRDVYEVVSRSLEQG